MRKSIKLALLAGSALGITVLADASGALSPANGIALAFFGNDAANGRVAAVLPRSANDANTSGFVRSWTPVSGSEDRSATPSRNAPAETRTAQAQAPTPASPYTNYPPLDFDPEKAVSGGFSMTVTQGVSSHNAFNQPMQPPAPPQYTPPQPPAPPQFAQPEPPKPPRPPEPPKFGPYPELPKPAYQPPRQAAPAYAQPNYAQPAYQAPAYQAPAYQAPAYQAPAYQPPRPAARPAPRPQPYAAPQYGYPQPYGAAPAYQQPAYQQPAYQQPAYRQPAYPQAPAAPAYPYAAPGYPGGQWQAPQPPYGYAPPAPYAPQPVAPRSSLETGKNVARAGSVYDPSGRYGAYPALPGEARRATPARQPAPRRDPSANGQFARGVYPDASGTGAPEMAARNPWTMDSTALAAWQPGWRPAPKASAQARSIAPLRIEPRRAKPAPQASAVQPFHGPYPPLGADDFIAPVASATGSYALAAWR